MTWALQAQQALAGQPKSASLSSLTPEQQHTIHEAAGTWMLNTPPMLLGDFAPSSGLAAAAKAASPWSTFLASSAPMSGVQNAVAGSATEGLLRGLGALGKTALRPASAAGETGLSAWLHPYLDPESAFTGFGDADHLAGSVGAGSARPYLGERFEARPLCTGTTSPHIRRATPPRI